jgi:hypothetical protein
LICGVLHCSFMRLQYEILYHYLKIYDLKKLMMFLCYYTMWLWTMLLTFQKYAASIFRV